MYNYFNAMTLKVARALNTSREKAAATVSSVHLAIATFVQENSPLLLSEETFLDIMQTCFSLWPC